MIYTENYELVIAIRERSAGNDSVGSMWLDSKSFSKDTPIKDIIEWGRYADGKLIITVDSTKH